jgi:hypothetical protein
VGARRGEAQPTLPAFFPYVHRQPASSGRGRPAPLTREEGAPEADDRFDPQDAPDRATGSARSCRSQTPGGRFAAIPIGGYRSAVARHGTSGITEAGRDSIEGPCPEHRAKQVARVVGRGSRRVAKAGARRRPAKAALLHPPRDGGVRRRGPVARAARPEQRRDQRRGWLPLADRRRAAAARQVLTELQNQRPPRLCALLSSRHLHPTGGSAAPSHQERPRSRRRRRCCSVACSRVNVACDGADRSVPGPEILRRRGGGG